MSLEGGELGFASGGLEREVPDLDGNVRPLVLELLSLLLEAGQPVPLHLELVIDGLPVADVLAHFFEEAFGPPMIQNCIRPH